MTTRSTQELIKNLKVYGAKFVQVVELSSVKAVESQEAEDVYGCDQIRFEIIGKKFNYQLIPPCLALNKPSREFMLDVLSSIKLIE